MSFPDWFNAEGCISDMTSEELDALCDQLETDKYRFSFLGIRGCHIDGKPLTVAHLNRILTAARACNKIKELGLYLSSPTFSNPDDFGLNVTYASFQKNFFRDFESAITCIEDIVREKLISLQHVDNLFGIWRREKSTQRILKAASDNRKLRRLKLDLGVCIVNEIPWLSRILGENRLEELSIEGLDFSIGSFCFRYEDWQPLNKAIKANTSLTKLEIFNYSGEGGAIGQSFLLGLAEALLEHPGIRILNLSSNRLHNIWSSDQNRAIEDTFLRVLKKGKIIDFFLAFKRRYGEGDWQRPLEVEIEQLLDQNRLESLEPVRDEIFEKNNVQFERLFHDHILPMLGSDFASTFRRHKESLLFLNKSRILSVPGDFSAISKKRKQEENQEGDEINEPGSERIKRSKRA